jgi:hypothetical protein
VERRVTVALKVSADRNPVVVVSRSEPLLREAVSQPVGWPAAYVTISESGLLALTLTNFVWGLSSPAVPLKITLGDT